MQTDFKEERKWKAALACELAYAVLEWHIAGSNEERIRLRICGRWRRPEEDNRVAESSDNLMDVDIFQAEQSEPEDEDDSPSREDQNTQSEEEGESPHKPQEDIIDELRTSAVIEDTDAVQNSAISQQAPSQTDDGTKAPKIEEVDNTDALRALDTTDSAMDIDLQDKSFMDTSNETKPEEDDSQQNLALKITSTNPTLQHGAPDKEANAKPGEPVLSPERLKSLRAALLSLRDDVMVVSFGELDSSKESKEAEGSMTSEQRALEGVDFTSIFPELQPYGLLDVPSSEIVGSSSEGRRKSEKRDRDDPNKRVDEATYTKLYPASTFMRKKPTLVSSLQPAKKWRKGRWINLDDSPVVSDVDGPPPAINEESTCCKFL